MTLIREIKFPRTTKIRFGCRTGVRSARAAFGFAVMRLGSWKHTRPLRRDRVHGQGAVAAVRTDGADRDCLPLGLQPDGAAGTQQALR